LSASEIRDGPIRSAMLSRVSLALYPGYGRLQRTAPWITSGRAAFRREMAKKIRRSELSHGSAGW
jgi:hypothetical protein